jgi:hypothetical protein
MPVSASKPSAPTSKPAWPPSTMPTKRAKRRALSTASKPAFHMTHFNKLHCTLLSHPSYTDYTLLHQQAGATTLGNQLHTPSSEPKFATSFFFTANFLSLRSWLYVLMICNAWALAFLARSHIPPNTTTYIPNPSGE